MLRTREVSGLGQPSFANFLIGLAGASEVASDIKRDVANNEEVISIDDVAFVAAVYGLGNFVVGAIGLLRRPDRLKSAVREITGYGMVPSIATIMASATIARDIWDNLGGVAFTEEQTQELDDEFVALVGMLIVMMGPYLLKPGVKAGKSIARLRA